MRHRLAPWLMLSAALHATAVAIDERPERGASATTTAPLDFELLETPVVPALPPSTVQNEPALRSRRPLKAARARPPAPAPGARAAPEPMPGRPQALAPRDSPPIATPRPQSLSPRAAALTLMTPSDSPSDAQGEAAPAPASAAQKLNEAILKGAAPPPEAPDEPVLSPGPRGGYLYKGKGFDATIGPDGSLTLRDRFGTARIPLVPYRNERGKWRVGLGFGVTFRLFEWLDRKFGKNDPYRSERRWFLERTRALRERLMREHAPELREPPADTPSDSE